MIPIVRELATLDIGNDRVVIVESRLPDITVRAFIKTLDAQARLTYRHEPNVEKEIQWFALANDIYGSIVAYGSLEATGDNEVIFGCVVHQDYRGRGVGNAMYRAATGLALRYRRRAIIAEQDHDNHAARALCIKEGFVFSEPEDDMTSSSGKIVRLRKDIQ